MSVNTKNDKKIISSEISRNHKRFMDTIRQLERKDYTAQENTAKKIMTPL